MNGDTRPEPRDGSPARSATDERFQCLVEMSSDAIILGDRAGIILYASPSLERVLGYAPATLLGQSGFNLVHVDDMPLAQSVLQRSVEQPRVHVPFLLRARHQDGSWRWVNGVCTNHLDNAPVQAIVVNFRDVTEDQQALQALRTSQRRYHSLVENLPVCLYRKDGAGRFTYANQRFCAFLGKPFEEVIGRTDHDLFSPELADAFRRDDESVFTGGTALKKEEALQTPGHPPEYVEAIKVPIRDGDGIAGVQGIFWNIDERKEAERALRESEERYRSVVEGSLQGILIHQDGVICYANGALARMFDYDSPREIIGQAVWQVFVLPENIGELQERTRAILSGVPIPPHPGWRAVGKHGRAVWVTTTASRIQFRGRPAVVAFYLDITEHKRVEEERRRLEAQIQHGQKLESLGVLAGGIAHDFNNLLTSMLGYAGLALMHVPEDAPAYPMLREIEEAALRAADLTQQMLAYSGRGRFLVQTLRLDLLVHEMVKLLQAVVSKKASIELSLEPATIEADATQVRQLVMNLMTNASDALEGRVGVIRVRTGTRKVDTAELRSPFLPGDLPAGTYAFVEVEDNGCGMDADTLPRIFDPFFTTKFTGRGLGLAAALGIVRGHRGTIKVSSTPGQGTLFQVQFPCVAAVAPAPLPARPPAPALRGQGVVLVVEDEPSVRSLAQVVLERGGFHVRTAEDGGRGLELFAKHGHEVAAVLLDLTMPHVDGIEFLRQLRRVDERVPVLIMSGYSEAEVSSRIAESGANGFIQKPFQSNDLLTRVCQLLQPSTDNGGV